MVGGLCKGNTTWVASPLRLWWPRPAVRLWFGDPAGTESCNPEVAAKTVLLSSAFVTSNQCCPLANTQSIMGSYISIIWVCAVILDVFVWQLSHTASWGSLAAVKSICTNGLRPVCIFLHLLSLELASQLDFKGPQSRWGFFRRKPSFTALYWTRKKKEKDSISYWPAIQGHKFCRKKLVLYWVLLIFRYYCTTW